MPRNRIRRIDPTYLPIEVSGYDVGLPASTPTEVNSQYETMTDVVNENYRERVAAGEIFNNPVSYTKVSNLSGPGGTYRAQHKTNPSIVLIRDGGGLLTWFERNYSPQAYHTDFMPKVDIPTSHVDEAKSKALGFIDRAPHSFAEDLAEIRETVRFLKNPIGSLRNFSRAFERTWKKRLKDLRFKDARSVSDAFAKLWLEYRFAFSPLLRSAEDACLAFQTRVTRPTRKVARGHTDWAHFEKGKVNAGTFGSKPNYYVYDRTLLQTQEVKAGVLYEVTNPLNDWRYKYGLRFKDIPETMWAILPYSFMVDRILNISQSVRGIQNFLDPNVRYLASWVTKKTLCDRTISFTDQVIDSYAISISPDLERKEEFSYTRDVWEPTLSDTVGSFDPTGLVDDIPKVVDLCSLILANIRK